MQAESTLQASFKQINGKLKAFEKQDTSNLEASSKQANNMRIATQKQAESKLSAQTCDAASLPKMTTVSQHSFDLASEHEKKPQPSLFVRWHWSSVVRQRTHIMHCLL